MFSDLLFAKKKKIITTVKEMMIDTLDDTLRQINK